MSDRELLELADLTQLLLTKHADKLPQWYCDLNCFRKPEGFPIELGEVDLAHRENHEFMKAFDAVRTALGDAGASRAWWQHELGKTEDEWRQWWTGRGLPLPFNTNRDNG